MAGRKPDYALSVKRKNGQGVNVQVGAAWKQPNGGITITLNPCTVLSHSDDVFIGLFPINQTDERNPPDEVDF